MSSFRKLTDIEVNGEILHAADVRTRAAQIQAERRAVGADSFSLGQPALQAEALELLIDRMLLVQESRRLGLEPSPSDVSQMLAEMAGRYDGVTGCRAGLDTLNTREDVTRRMLLDRILDRWRASVRRPRAEDVGKHYTANKQQFYAPEHIKAAHIVRSKERYASSDEGRSDLEQLRTRVERGEAFAKVAEECSDCPENGGELGWFPRGLMVEDFDQVVFATPPGQLTPVFETCFDYHFAMVHEKRPAGIRSLSEVRSEIEEALWLTKQDREVGRRLQDLRNRAVIRSVV